MENNEKKKDFIGWLINLVRKCLVIFVPGLVAAIVIFLIIEAMLIPTSSEKFCGTLCHEMDVAYESWQKSSHFGNSAGIKVKCISCHLPPKDKYFTHLAAKAYTGTKDCFYHMIGKEFNVEEMSQKVLAHMKNETCMNCHSNLLGNTADELVTEIHNDVINPPEGTEKQKCIECHEDAGHDKGLSM